MKLLKISLIIFLSICIPSLVLADYRNSDPLEYLNMRQMSMGGAGVAVINGAETVYANPAGATKAGDHWAIPLVPVLITDGTLQIGDDSIKVLNDFKGALAKSQDDTSKQTILFAKLIPSALSGGACVPYLYTGRSFIEGFGTHMAIGGYSRAYGNYELLNPVSPRLEYKSRVDTTMGITFARYIDEKGKVIPEVRNLAIGYSAKHINRQAAYDTERQSETAEITITDIVNEDISYEYYDATGWGFDLGFLGDIDTGIGDGRFGLAFYNIGSRLQGKTFLVTTENVEDTDDILVQIPTTAKLGIAVKNMLMKSISFGLFDRPTLLAMDYDIIYPATSYVKRMHIGVEQPLNDITFWQLGLNQGYGTMGLQWRWPNYSIGISYFTEELGREVGQKPASYLMLKSGFIF